MPSRIVLGFGLVTWKIHILLLREFLTIAIQCEPGYLIWPRLQLRGGRPQEVRLMKCRELTPKNQS